MIQLWFQKLFNIPVSKLDLHPLVDPHVLRERDIQPTEPNQLRGVLTHGLESPKVFLDPRHKQRQMIYLVRIHATKISGRTEKPKCVRGKDPESTVEVSIEFCEEGSEGARIFHSKSYACQRVEARPWPQERYMRGEKSCDAGWEGCMVWVAGNTVVIKCENLQ
jgi:hypothetical protein